MAERLSSSPRTELGTAVASTFRMEDGGRLKSAAASLCDKGQLALASSFFSCVTVSNKLVILSGEDSGGRSQSESGELELHFCVMFFGVGCDVFGGVAVGGRSKEARLGDFIAVSRVQQGATQIHRVIDSVS